MISKNLKEGEMKYRIDSLRMAFSKAKTDELTCIVSINNDGYLSVKITDE
jgi:hypothetical protein